MLEYALWLYETLFYVGFTLTNICLVIYIVNKFYNKWFTVIQNGSGKFALITGCDSGFGHLAAHELNKKGV